MVNIESFKKKINLYRRWSHWSKAKCIFIHVPKAAGTSVNRALYGRTLGHYTAGEINGAFPRLYEKSFVFSLVRNPWDRAYSAYRFARVGRTESMGVYKPEQYQIPEFESFERFVLDWLPSQRLATVDYIFRKQSDFLTNNENKLDVDYVGKIEGIDAALSFVSSKIGRELRVGRENVTSGKVFDYRTKYCNSEMVDVIGSLYADDAILFDYRFGS